MSVIGLLVFMAFWMVGCFVASDNLKRDDTNRIMCAGALFSFGGASAVWFSIGMGSLQ